MTYQLTAVDRERFVTALKAAADGPSEAELAAAPILEGWFTAGDLLFPWRPTLIGCVTGHPSLAESLIQTSCVLAINAQEGYARTQSRWYRLGKPVADIPQDELPENILHTVSRCEPLTEDQFDNMILAERSLLQETLDAVLD